MAAYRQEVLRGLEKAALGGNFCEADLCVLEHMLPYLPTGPVREDFDAFTTQLGVHDLGEDSLKQGAALLHIFNVGCKINDQGIDDGRFKHTYQTAPGENAADVPVAFGMVPGGWNEQYDFNTTNSVKGFLGQMVGG